MRNGEAYARQVIEEKLQWHSLGTWLFEFPVAHAYHPASGQKTGAPRRIDAILPSSQILVEVKTNPNDLQIPGTYQLDHNAHLLYHQRGIGGTWTGVVTDGETCYHRRYFLGAPISCWDEVHPNSIYQNAHISHNRDYEEFGWMAQGLRLTYKDGVRSIICRECDDVKPAHLFYRNVRMKYQRNDICRVCDNQGRLQRYHNSKEENNNGI